MPETITAPAIDLDRLARLTTISLSKGAHEPDGQMCAMEAVAYISGEPWSDHPECACPVISDFLRSWNDSLPDNATRDRLLKPLILKLIGTRSPSAVEQARGYLALDWLVRVSTPTWLDLIECCREEGAALRALPEIRDYDSLVAAIEPCRRAEKRAAAAWAAAWDAARDAAGVAAGAAAWVAAGDAAGDALKSTVTALQQSAIDLLERMIALEVAS